MDKKNIIGIIESSDFDSKIAIEKVKAANLNNANMIVIKNEERVDKNKLIELAKESKKNKLKEIHIVTNATKKYDDFIEPMKTYGLKRAYIKLNKITQALSIKKKKFVEIVLHNIKTLNENNIELYGIIKLNKNSLNFLGESIAISHISGINEFYIIFPKPTKNKKDISYSLVKEDIDKIIEKYDGTKIKINLINFPYCVLSTKNNTILNHTHVFRTIFDNLSEIDKIEDCKLCKYSLICNGIDINYINYFGKEEFKPIDGFKISPDMLEKNKLNNESNFTKKRLELNVGLACNNDCNFCISGKKQIKLDPPEKIIQEIDKYKGKGIDLLNILGGEPTLVKKLPEVILHAKKSGFNTIQIITNGRRLKDYEFAKSLVMNGLNRISITIHGHNAKIQDSTVQREGAFDETIQGIKNIVKIKNETGINVKLTSGICITKKNYRFLKETAEMISKLGIEEILFINLNPEGNCEDDLENIIPKYSDVRLRLKEAVDYCNINNVSVAFDGFAHCIIHGISEFQEEDFDQKDEVTSYDFDDKNRSNFDWIDVRKDKKTKSKVCIECKLNYKCEGIWKAYTELQGFSDFKPIK